MKNKETGEQENLTYIEKQYKELLANSDEFNKYKDNLELFLRDFYEAEQ